MMLSMNSVILSFIGLFVAINVLGILPIFIGFTQGMENAAKSRLINMAVLTSCVVSIVFLFSGRFLFHFLGITESDFRVAGGLVLLVLSIYDLLFSNEKRRQLMTQEKISVTPLAIPMLIGPATMTALIALTHSYGYVNTLLSLILNLVVVWAIFKYSHFINKFLGEAGSRAFAKVASLFLGAIAVMMIRIGIMGMIK